MRPSHHRYLYEDGVAKISGDKGEELEDDSMLEDEGTMESVDNMIASLVKTKTPLSAVLRLEALETDVYADNSAWSQLIGDKGLALQTPGRKGDGDTAHVYISSPGAAALDNHTDTTEILVLQLHGPSPHLAFLPLARLPLVSTPHPIAGSPLRSANKTSQLQFHHYTVI